MKGWDYKINTWTRKVKNGEVIEVERVTDTGVLVGITLITNDCFGGFNFTGQGADLSINTLIDVYPKVLNDSSAYQQDPTGWIQRYYRPNPQSSAGAYLATVFGSGFQGSTFPYVPSTIVRVFLRAESTQAEADISVSIIRLIITDRKQFIKSLRAVLGADTIQEIDPALLSPGLQEITQKGPLEKEQNKP